jgi:DNA primase
MMTLLDLLHSDGFQPKKLANTHGGEYAGACPFCGGEDRFRVWPEDNGGRYWCRQCEKKGDAIQYLRDHRGLSYHDACRAAGVQFSLRTDTARLGRHEKSIFTLKETSTPAGPWQQKAGAFMEQAKRELWTNTGKDAQVFLHGKGLADETIRAAALGWHPSDVYLARESWGLPAEVKADGKLKKLWLPAGIVIPCLADSKVIRLKIRRMEPDTKPRYVILPISSSASMVWNMDRKAVVIVESELDGILVNQEAGDLVGVVALGSAQVKADRETHNLLQKADSILVSLDADDAGAKAAWQLWMKQYPRAQRWPCVRGKDPSEAWAKGLNIRAWIMAGLPGEASPASAVDVTDKPAEAILEQEIDRRSDGIPSDTVNLLIDEVRTKPPPDHPEPKTTACPICGNSNYWMSVARTGWTCETCHSPSRERFVAERR